MKAFVVSLLFVCAPWSIAMAAEWPMVPTFVHDATPVTAVPPFQPAGYCNRRPRPFQRFQPHDAGWFGVKPVMHESIDPAPDQLRRGLFLPTRWRW